MSEIRKRKKGQVLSNNERQLIMNLMSYLKEKHVKKSLSEIIREISASTGCSERTIYKIKKEASKGVTFAPSKTRVRKKENKNSRNIKYDSFVKSSIRRKVYNYFLQNIPPSLNSILTLVNGDPDLPKFKRSTLHTLLKEIGFVYEQKGKKSLLSERNDLIKSRQEYLKIIQKCRLENKWIIYTGETLINVIKNDLQTDKCEEMKYDNNCFQKSDSSGCSTINAVIVNAPQFITTQAALVYTIDSSTAADGVCNEFINLTGEQIVHQVEAVNSLTEIPIQGNIYSPSTVEESPKIPLPAPETQPIIKNSGSKELNLKVMHACSNEGFLQGTELVTICKKGKADETDSYEHWFMEKLLPKVPPNSIVVSDSSASFREKKGNSIPDSSWKKQHIKNWLLSENINVGDVCHKKELLALVNSVRPLFSVARHKIDEMAKKKGVKIVNLPPFHYELNPLNLVWTQIKYYVRSNLGSFKIKKIKELIKEGFHSISQISWMNHIKTVKETEELLLNMQYSEKNKNNL